MTTANDRIYAALNEVTGKLGEVSGTLNALRDEVREKAERDEKAREKIEAAATEAGKIVAAAINRIETLEASVAELKPFAAKADRWERKGIWAAGFLAALGMIAGGLIKGPLDALLKLFSAGPPPGP